MKQNRLKKLEKATDNVKIAFFSTTSDKRGIEEK